MFPCPALLNKRESRKYASTYVRYNKFISSCAATFSRNKTYKMLLKVILQASCFFSPTRQSYPKKIALQFSFNVNINRTDVQNSSIYVLSLTQPQTRNIYLRSTRVCMRIRYLFPEHCVPRQAKVRPQY